MNVLGVKGKQTISRYCRYSFCRTEGCSASMGRKITGYSRLKSILQSLRKWAGLQEWCFWEARRKPDLAIFHHTCAITASRRSTPMPFSLLLSG